MPKCYTDEFKVNSIELHKSGLKIPKQLYQEYGIGNSKDLKWSQDKMPDKSACLNPNDCKAQVENMNQLE